jgi:hypothetical protein
MGRTLKWLGVVLACATGAVWLGMGCSSGGGGGGGGNTPVVKPPAPPAFSTGTALSAALTQSTFGAAGGTASVTDATSPIKGTSIVVPPNATTENVTFSVKQADVTGVSGLKTGAVPTSKMITIEASGSDAWNQYRMFDLPVLVTLPYTPPADGEETVRFYRVNPDNTLEATGFAKLDTTAKTISFHVRTFASAAQGPAAGINAVTGAATAQQTFARYVAIGLGQLALQWWQTGKTIDTGFRPSANGWYLPNYGSYYKKAQGGNCFGMVGFAQWYFKNGFGPVLYESYRDANKTATWVDDATAIQLASRVQNAMLSIWAKYQNGELNLQTPSSRQVALSWIGALYVTDIPALVYIQQVVTNAAGAKTYSGAHAISIYGADIGTNGNVVFHVYDPNFRYEASNPGKSDRSITYTSAGFAIYNSGTTAAESNFKYNYFQHVGFHVGLSDALLSAYKTQADGNFGDNTVFPKITVTRITGKNNGETVYDAASPATAKQGTTANGEHKFITSDNAVVVEGTITGGLSQNACCSGTAPNCISCVVNKAEVLLTGQDFAIAVNNGNGTGDGKFSFTAPLKQGEDELVIVGGTVYKSWAGFFREIVESTASAAALTVTLSWDQGQSDVDLYVKEPNQAAPGTKVGDTVYYSHRKGLNTTAPYLDFDNTSGFGPEHYVAARGMKSLYTDGSAAPDLYGDYTYRVHYYSDHDGNSAAIQPITWHVTWKYLAYCPDPCTNPDSDGFWVNGSADGSLSAASSSNCCDITHTGADWSAPFTISYAKPNPADWGTVPASNTVMLP